MRYSIIAITLCALFTNCTTSKKYRELKISVETLKKWMPDTIDSYTFLEVLRAYPALDSCTISKNYSNLYICKTRLKAKIDTIYIFDNCSEHISPSEDGKTYTGVGFALRDTIKIKPPITYVSVPLNFFIPKNANCFFVKLNQAFQF